jgi:cyanate lyase
MNHQKNALGEKILLLKKQKSLTWPQIAAEIRYSPSWTCAACLGQMSMPPEAAAKVAALLGLSPEDQATLQDIPYRGSLPSMPPTDPLIYRFYELMMVYGTTFKQMIEEEFGDGIMSAIDFDMNLERQPDPKGDRVRITFSGKFLPYKRY